MNSSSSRRRRSSKTPMGGTLGAGGVPKIHTEASELEQEELDCYPPVDFTTLLARRQQFVEEIRHKRFSLHVAEEDKHGDKELLPSCADIQERGGRSRGGTGGGQVAASRAQRIMLLLDGIALLSCVALSLLRPGSIPSFSPGGALSCS